MGDCGYGEWVGPKPPKSDCWGSSLEKVQAARGYTHATGGGIA